MRFLSTAQFARITIEGRNSYARHASAGPSINFIVPVELAGLLFLFLASSSARLIALLLFGLARELVLNYRQLMDYLAGWREDLIIIRLAVLDLVGVPVSGYAAT